MRLKWLMACFIVLLISPIKIHAEGNLELNVDCGIQGKAKQEQGFPVKVTIKNNGDDFSGDLVITMSPNPNSAGNLVFPVEIAAKGTKGITTTVGEKKLERSIETKIKNQDRMDSLLKSKNRSR